MADLPTFLRAAAIVAFVAAILAAVAAIDRRAVPPIVMGVPQGDLAPDDLSAELRRCGKLGPGDPPDISCQAVWEESRRRFFGEPVRPLPPASLKDAAAPVGATTTAVAPVVSPASPATASVGAAPTPASPITIKPVAGGAR
jgi:conjugative transfer region protein TrbK